MTTEAHDQATSDTIRSTTSCTPPTTSPQLRKLYRGFVFPATVAFLAWYLLYVVHVELGAPTS